MLIPDDALAEIDASSGGNRTAFMVAAARIGKLDSTTMTAVSRGLRAKLDL
jgi:hypothetical protein